MLKNQMELISEKEINGKGVLFCNLSYLGECDYSLKIRKSCFKVKKDRPGIEIEELDFMMTTILGTITIDDNFIEPIYKKCSELTLHLNDDYLLLPINAFPMSPEQLKVVSHVVTQPVQ